jgi:hypothetical protein
MPKGPKGEKRPADAIGNAVMIARIATGEIEDITTEDGKNAPAMALGRMGGKARAEGRRPSGGKKLRERPPKKDGATEPEPLMATFFHPVNLRKCLIGKQSI